MIENMKVLIYWVFHNGILWSHVYVMNKSAVADVIL